MKAAEIGPQRNFFVMYYFADHRPRKGPNLRKETTVVPEKKIRNQPIDSRPATDFARLSRRDLLVAAGAAIGGSIVSGTELRAQAGDNRAQT